MSTKREVHYILGYVGGGLLVLGLIPLALRRASRVFDRRIGRQLIPHAGLRLPIANALALFGILFGVWSIIVQNKAGKGGPLEAAGIEVSPKTQNLVVTGPYKFTRNPMLFGTCVFYYGIAVYLNSPGAAVLVTLFMTFMLIFVKKTEEPRLLSDFGTDYEDYRRRVSMFVPWLDKRRPDPVNS